MCTTYLPFAEPGREAGLPDGGRDGDFSSTSPSRLNYNKKKSSCKLKGLDRTIFIKVAPIINILLRCDIIRILILVNGVFHFKNICRTFQEDYG